MGCGLPWVRASWKWRGRRAWRSGTRPGPGSKRGGGSRLSFDFSTLARLNVHCHRLAYLGTLAIQVGLADGPADTPQLLVAPALEIGHQLLVGFDLAGFHGGDGFGDGLLNLLLNLL